MIDEKIFTKKTILTPGPTEIPERIKLALASQTTNPDLDPLFHEEYFMLHQKLSRIIEGWHTKIFTLLGSASLAMEIAVTNFLNENEKAIVLTNGYFGDFFNNLLIEHNRKPVSFKWCNRRSLDTEEAIDFIEKHKEVKAVYMVHCETPTGVLNDIRGIGEYLKDKNTLLIVDAVSTIGATDIKMDEWGIDVLIGAGHKALNIPPGLSIIALSHRAWKKLTTVKQKGFYMNLGLWRDFFEKMDEAPYTLSQPLLKALETSLDMIIEEDENNVFKRHLKARKASFEAAIALGLEPYPEKIEYACPTVSALFLPSEISASEIFEIAWEKYGVMYGKGLGTDKEKIIRIGHMGVTASREYLLIAYSTLGKILLKKNLINRQDLNNALNAIEEIFN